MEKHHDDHRDEQVMQDPELEKNAFTEGNDNASSYNKEAHHEPCDRRYRHVELCLRWDVIHRRVLEHGLNVGQVAMVGYSIHVADMASCMSDRQ
mmetsp:Transcript_13954/g.22798  ORF Transcript_13954/g.22798 Transcript_13954/m.22798 type:complete len:94 (-) Transcript_13954:436-717(-)